MVSDYRIGVMKYLLFTSKVRTLHDDDTSFNLSCHVDLALVTSEYSRHPVSHVMHCLPTDPKGHFINLKLRFESAICENSYSVLLDELLHASGCDATVLPKSKPEGIISTKVLALMDLVSYYSLWGVT